MSKPPAYEKLFNYVVAKPNNYRNYGPWWWSVKHILRKNNQPVGHTDNPELRRIMEATIEHDYPSERDILEMAYEALKSNIGGIMTGYFTLPNGEGYYLTDQDVS